MLNTNSTVSQSSILTVGKNASLYDFTTVNAAVTHARQYCSKANRVVVKIASGTYNEQVDLCNNPGIDLIGEGMDTTILSYPSTYPNAPIYTTGQGYFSGLTFLATSGSNSYGLHYENGSTKISGTTVFRNCKFSSPHNAIGCGLGANSTLSLYNCVLQGTGGGAPLYLHNAAYANSPNQVFEMFDCVLYGKNSSSNESVLIDDAAKFYGVSNSTAQLRFSNNRMISSTKVIFRESETTRYPYIPVSNKNITLNPSNTGNTTRALNYNEGWKNGQAYVIKSEQTVYNANYYLYSVPMENADKYNITLTAVNIPGLASILSDCSIHSTSANGFVIKDTNPNGTNFGMEIAYTASLKG